jgi:hypothetical protein
VIKLPTLPEGERVFEYHMVTVRAELDHFGIADPKAFAAKLQKAGSPFRPADEAAIDGKRWRDVFRTKHRKSVN